MKNKIAIYTSLVGGYDTLVDPVVVFKECDYICFTNDIKTEKVGVWSIKPIPYYNDDPTILSRYVKLNPHKVLNEYDYSVWIDSNIQILDTFLYERILLMINSGTLLGVVKHPDKNCIYQDARMCLLQGVSSYWGVWRQIRYLKKCGYPESHGLYENNLIFRKHNNALIIKASNEWWDMYQNFSKRDQLSWCFVLWQNNITPDWLLGEDINTNDTDHFKRRIHNYTKIYYLKRKIRSLYNNLLFRIFKF